MTVSDPRRLYSLSSKVYLSDYDERFGPRYRSLMPYSWRHERRWPRNYKQVHISPTDSREYGAGVIIESHEQEEPTGPMTDYQAEYQRLRKLMRPTDVQILDLVLHSGMKQTEIAKQLKVTQGAIGHAFARAQHNLKMLATRPPYEGVSRALYRYLGPDLALSIRLFISTTSQSTVARMWRSRSPRCTQVSIRARIYRSLRYLRVVDDPAAERAIELIEWTLAHPNIRCEMPHRKRALL